MILAYLLMPRQAGCIRSSQKVGVSGNVLPGGSYMLTVKYIAPSVLILSSRREQAILSTLLSASSLQKSKFDHGRLRKNLTDT